MSADMSTSEARGHRRPAKLRVAQNRGVSERSEVRNRVARKHGADVPGVTAHHHFDVDRSPRVLDISRAWVGGHEGRHVLTPQHKRRGTAP